MRQILQGFVVAFAMYSKIPMPKIQWTKENMKYCVCFFPLIGVVIGLLMRGWFWLSQAAGFGVTFRTCVLILIPVAVSGGIHLDGYADTIDAISSYGDREKKLQILKDPHTGAFAVIGLCVYFVAVLALWSEAESYMLPIAACMYPLSRSLSGISVVSFHPAKNSGLLRTFQDGAQKKRVRIALIIWACICAGLMLYLGWQQGGAFVAGAAAVIAAALLVFAYYHRMSRKKFGGTTGDLAGYFLQMCELAMLAVIVLVGKII